MILSRLSVLRPRFLLVMLKLFVLNAPPIGSRPPAVDLIGGVFLGKTGATVIRG